MKDKYDCQLPEDCPVPWITDDMWRPKVGEMVWRKLSRECPLHRNMPESAFARVLGEIYWVHYYLEDNHDYAFFDGVVIGRATLSELSPMVQP